jgi:hypothetical protein
MNMKHKSKPENKHESHFEHNRENAEVAEFHSKRMTRELKIETKKESPNKPEGNYEYQQLIAEEASFNAKPMIEEAAFYIAEQRGFAPGCEVSDWLQAEANVEGLLRSTSAEEGRPADVEDRRS